MGKKKTTKKQNNTKSQRNIPRERGVKFTALKWKEEVKGFAEGPVNLPTQTLICKCS